MITLSVKEILKEIYALSALRAFNNQYAQPVASFTPDNYTPLSLAVTEAASVTLAGCGNSITSVTFRPEWPAVAEEIDVDIDVGSSAMAPALRRALEAAIVYRTLSTVYLDDNATLASHYLSRALTSEENVRFLASQLLSGPLPSIIPHYY